MVGHVTKDNVETQIRYMDGNTSNITEQVNISTLKWVNTCSFA